jgi:hypothetical protein
MTRVSIKLNEKTVFGFVDETENCDGIYKVRLDDNTIYFAEFKELQFAVQEKIVKITAMGWEFNVKMQRGNALQMHFDFAEVAKRPNLSRKELANFFKANGFNVGRDGSLDAWKGVAAEISKQLEDVYYCWYRA